MLAHKSIRGASPQNIQSKLWIFTRLLPRANPTGSHPASEYQKNKQDPTGLFYFSGEGRPDVVARLCMVVDWCIDHPEYTAKIKVIPKKDYPVLMPCEF